MTRSEAALAVAEQATVWAEALDRYETECRREHEPWRAYPEADKRRRSESQFGGWDKPPRPDALQRAAAQARYEEDKLRRLVSEYVEREED